eukprot:1919979-Amphidinium_carterae.1
MGSNPIGCVCKLTEQIVERENQMTEQENVPFTSLTMFVRLNCCDCHLSRARCLALFHSTMRSSLLAHLKPKGAANPFGQLEAAAERRGEVALSLSLAWPRFRRSQAAGRPSFIRTFTQLPCTMSRALEEDRFVELELEAIDAIDPPVWRRPNMSVFDKKVERMAVIEE